MTDPIDALVRAAQAAGAADLDPDPVAAVRARVARHRSRRRARFVAAATAAAAVVAAASIAVVAATGEEEEGLDVVDQPPSVEPTTAPSPSTGAPTTAPTATGEVPLDFRGDVALAWTGTEVVVWGGDVETFNMGVSGEDRSFTDGAAYDIATGTWRTMAPSPLPVSDETPTAAATDAGVVIVRGAEAALWDPEEDTWRSLADAPTSVALLAAGDRVFGLGGSGLVRLDVDDGTWHELPEPPVTLETLRARPAAVWTGEEIVLAGPAPGFQPGPMHAAAFDPQTETWRRLPDAPAAIGSWAPTAAWDGERVVVVDYQMGAATFTPASGDWAVLPDVPARFSEWRPLTVSAGGVTSTTMAYATVVLGEDGAWTPLPHGQLPLGQSVAIDPAEAPTARVAVWVVDTAAEASSLAVVDLATLASATLRRHVGAGSVELAPDDVLVDARLEPTTRSDDLLVESVVLEVDVAEGGRCTVASTYPGALGSEAERAVPETLELADGPKPWFHDEAGRHWETEAGDTDLFTVDCDEPAAARRIAATAAFDLDE